MKFYIAALFCISILLAGPAGAQTVWENPKASVYPYLQRMADKGLIDFNDLVQPIGRNIIYKHLLSLQSIETQLTFTEKKELHFYLEEYAAGYGYTRDAGSVKAFNKDIFGRWRPFSVESKAASLHIDPIVGGGYINGSGKAVRQYSGGVDLWGNFGKHFSYQLYFRDFFESGTGIDSFRLNTPETGILPSWNKTNNSLNYSETRAALTYSWKKGSISLVQDHLQWGYGQNGLMVLSDKSPVYPYLRFDYQLFKWLSFNYEHAMLSSDIIDSAKTFTTSNMSNGVPVHTYFQPKFMAMHSINIRFSKGLSGALGESIVYNNTIQYPYFIPVLFYFLYDYMSSNSNLGADSKKQFFFELSSRNQIPKTHLYATLYINELSVTNIFDPVKRRNQVGFAAGIEKRDFLIPYLSLGLEYTRVNPFVYRDFIPAEDYSNHGYYLGDWMGNNFDRLIVVAKYHPLPKLALMARYQYSRKGGPGTLWQQYYQQPQPPFLFDLQNKTGEATFQCNYEWAHRFYINLSYQLQQIHYYVLTDSRQQIQTGQLGISYGL